MSISLSSFTVISNILITFALSFGGAYDERYYIQPQSETAKHHIRSQGPGLNRFFTMEHSKEFYESVIRVIDYINPYAEEVWDVMPDKGIELAGDYWPEIGRMLHKDLEYGWFDHGRFRVTKRPLLASLRKDCEHIIEKMDKAEVDRNTDRKYKIKGILYGRISLIISILALLFSIFVWVRQSGLI